MTDDQEADRQVLADRQTSEGEEWDPSDNDRGTAEMMGRTLQRTVEPPLTRHTTRHTIHKNTIFNFLRQALKGLD